MKTGDFNNILRSVKQLTPRQRGLLREALGEEVDESAGYIAEIVEPKDRGSVSCPHCGASGRIQRWGRSHGLQRYRCRDCSKTFNPLTGTPLHRLRKKHAWGAYGYALHLGLSVRKAGPMCDIHYTTAFRWRHRFLRMPAWEMAGSVGGIVEADETFFLESFKGKRLLPRPPRKRGGVAKKRGISREQIPVITIRDRYGATRDQVISGIGAKQIEPVIRPALEPDAILCSDGARSYKVIAARLGIEHHPTKAVPGERTKGPYHIQNVNAFHSRLKGWMRRFKGVSTEHLQNYLGWHRMLDRHGVELDFETVLKSAIGDTGPTVNAN